MDNEVIGTLIHTDPHKFIQAVLLDDEDNMNPLKLIDVKLRAVYIGLEGVWNYVYREGDLKYDR